MTVREIAFGDGAGVTGNGRIEGSIDRQTLETRIVVHSSRVEERPGDGDAARLPHRRAQRLTIAERP